MADVRELRGGGGAIPADMRFYAHTAPTGITTITEDGLRQFKLDGSSADILGLGAEIANPAVGDDYASLLFGVTWKGDLAGGGGDAGIPIYQISNKSPGLNVELEQVGTSDHYVVSVHFINVFLVHSVIGTGTIQIEADSVTPERAVVRIDADGTTLTTWISIDGGALTKDIEAATIYQFGGLILGQDGDISGAKPVYIFCPQLWHYDDPVARPGIDLQAAENHPSADYASTTWGSQDDCASADGSWGRWDDWAGGGFADDDTGSNCELGGEAGTEVSEMTDPVVTYPTRAALAGHYRVRSNTASKTTTLKAREEDGSNLQEKTLINIGADAFDHRAVIFNTDPNQTVWSQAKFNLVKVGARSIDTDNANLIVTALGGEILSTNDDPLIVAGESFPLVNPDCRLKPLVNGGLAA